VLGEIGKAGTVTSAQMQYLLETVASGTTLPGAKLGDFIQSGALAM
jgi:Zn finger protein HypA/HybF involved in hydrogenase expression